MVNVFLSLTKVSDIPAGDGKTANLFLQCKENQNEGKVASMAVLAEGGGGDGEWSQYYDSRSRTFDCMPEQPSVPPLTYNCSLFSHIYFSSTAEVLYPKF